MSDSKEPQPEFTGVWIPATVMELFWAGTVTAKEMLLLATIDALRDGGAGCYASNSFLTKRMTLSSVTSTQNMILRLERLGLLVRDNSTKRRRLWTVWGLAAQKATGK